MDSIENHYIFLDTETSGLDPSINQILTLGLIISDKNFNILFEKEYKIKQNKFSKIEDNALEVNHINLEEHNKIAVPEWTNCMNIAHDIFKITGAYFGNISIGHNVLFDLNFIRIMFERTKVFPPFHYHFIDTLGLALILKKSGLLPTENLKLETICKYFNYTASFHNALEDTKATMFIYKKMIEKIRGK